MSGLNAYREASGAQTNASTLVTSPGDANMKPLLHLTTVVLLLYVALCTHTVLTVLTVLTALTVVEGDSRAPPALLPHIMGE